MMLLNCSSGGGGDNVNTTTTYLADQIASSRNVIGDGAGEGRGPAYGHALHPNRFKWGCAAYVCEFDFIFRIKMLANLIFKNNINMLYNKVEDLSHPSSTSPDRNDRTACPRRRHIAPSLCRCLAGDCPRPPCRTPPLRWCHGLWRRRTASTMMQLKWWKLNKFHKTFLHFFPTSSTRWQANESFPIKIHWSYTQVDAPIPATVTGWLVGWLAGWWSLRIPSLWMDVSW